MAYELQRLTAKHKVVLSLALRGHSREEIARATGLSPNAVTYVVHSQVGQDEMARRQQSIELAENREIANEVAAAHEMLQREALPSVMAMVDVRDRNGGDQNLKLRAAKDILSLAFGQGGVVSGSVVNNTIMVNNQRIVYLQQVAREAGLERALVNASSDGNGSPTTTDDVGRAADDQGDGPG